MKKKWSEYATFRRLVAIGVCITQMAGCGTMGGIPERDFQASRQLVDVGTMFLRERRLDEARIAFELASELAPMAAAVDGLGCVALLEGRYDSAEGYFTEAYQMDRSYDEALLNLGLLKDLQGYSDEARSIYLDYLDKNPWSGGVRNNLAALEYDRGRRRMDTVTALEKAIVLSGQGVIRDNLAVLRAE